MSNLTKQFWQRSSDGFYGYQETLVGMVAAATSVFEGQSYGGISGTQQVHGQPPPRKRLIQAEAAVPPQVSSSRFCKFLLEASL